MSNEQKIEKFRFQLVRDCRFFFGTVFFVNFEERFFLQNQVAGLALLISLSSLYFIIMSFKLKGIGIFGLIAVLMVWMVLLLCLIAFSKVPETSEQASGTGWSLLFSGINVVLSLFLFFFYRKKTSAIKLIVVPDTD